MARVRGSGFIVVYNRIPWLMAAVESNARAAVKKNADKIRDEAKRRVPVATGQLRQSITSAVVGTGKESVVVVGAEYGAYVEFGTYKMPARPFLYPAVQMYADDFFDDVGPGAFKF